MMLLGIEFGFHDLVGAAAKRPRPGLWTHPI